MRMLIIRYVLFHAQLLQFISEGILYIDQSHKHHQDCSQRCRKCDAEGSKDQAKQHLTEYRNGRREVYDMLLDYRIDDVPLDVLENGVAARSAKRVLPTPPGPTSVTRRAPARAALTSWSCRRRPMKLVSSAGRFPGGAFIGCPAVRCSGRETSGVGDACTLVGAEPRASLFIVCAL
jgi:hypothetical protein